MGPEQRDMLDEIITKIRAGRMRRRTFLEHAYTLGLASGTALSLLDACAGSGSSTGGTTINLVWQSEFDTSNAYKQLVDTFNQKNKDIHIIHQTTSNRVGDITALERGILQKHSPAIDIMSIDIVYPAEFAAKGWLVPITEQWWPLRERANYLSSPLQACTFQGQLWAVPYRTDVGLIYYRNDIIATAPTTWEELTESAIEHKSLTKYGYVWQGSLYEGLVCNFDEVLHGYGGAILDSADPTKVTINSAEAFEALSTMVNWIGTISPVDVVNYYVEDNARIIWQNGDAIFMRNWPYAYANAKNPSESKVVGKFDIHTMLHGGANTVGHSSIGGWQFGINAFINTDRKAASWKFIKYMLSDEAQKIGAIVANWAMTLQSLYDDADILAAAPLYKELKPIVQTSLPRPVTPNYIKVSLAIQQRIHQALTKTLSPHDALKALDADLRPLVKT